MTAVTVPIIAEEKVESPLSTPGSPIFFTRIRRLLLGDGSTVYACAECEYTAESVGKVRGHLGRVHRSDTKGRRSTNPASVPTSALGKTLGELLESHERAEALMLTVERQAEELAEWRSRARRAEKDLATLRRVLQGAVQ